MAVTQTVRNSACQAGSLTAGRWSGDGSLPARVRIVRRLGAWMALLALLAVLLSGCAPQPQVIQKISPVKEVSETPIVLVYHSPEPIMTRPPAPTPSLTPTLDHDPDYYYGSLTVTLDYAGQTINLKKGQNFLLNLGESYTWAVTLEPENIISLNRKLTPEPGEQGVYVARQPGKTLLRAIGQPPCRGAQPPCARPDLLFQVTVVVQ